MKAKLWFSQLSKRMKVGFALILLFIFGGIGYLAVRTQPEADSAEAALQTATIRRGDLTITASGTGVLEVSGEADLSFSQSGTVTSVLVKAGDKVQAGDLLAEIDNTDAQNEFDLADQNYMELTSPNAVASALGELAQAQRTYDLALYKLEYLISPDVMYWEQKIAETEQTLETAISQLNANPEDKNVSKQIEDSQSYLTFANSMLNKAHIEYDNVYTFDHFVKRKDGKSYLAIPSELEIKQARVAIDDAGRNLAEAKQVYAALTGGEIPEGTSIPALVAIEEAQRNLEKAQANLDGTKIFAPTDGTIISVNIATGDEAGTSTAIVMANLDKPYVDIYMDESDWDKAVVGNPVEVTFNSLPDSAFTGTINSVDRELYTSGGNTSVHTTALLDSTIDEINLPIGASASVEVTGTHAQNAILVPLEALQESDAGGYIVYVETADGVAPRSVTIGIQTELYAEIKSGLDEGEVVVTNPTEIQ